MKKSSSVMRVVPIIIILQLVVKALSIILSERGRLYSVQLAGLQSKARLYI